MILERNDTCQHNVKPTGQVDSLQVIPEFGTL